MRQVSGSPKAMLPGQHTVLPARFQVSGLLAAVALVLLLAAPVFADSKAENLKPLDPQSEVGKAAVTTNVPVSPELEEKYRAELEKRLEQERESYEGSLTSLWLSNAAVWGCLLVFIAMQALSARKKAAELARLKAEREK